MAYTYLSKKQANKGNATTYPSKKQGKCHYTVSTPSHHINNLGMGWC